jgi:hypothetical protein
MTRFAKLNHAVILARAKRSTGMTSREIDNVEPH